MTEIPEHLLNRSKARRADASGDASGDSAPSSTPASEIFKGRFDGVCLHEMAPIVRRAGDILA